MTIPHPPADDQASGTDARAVGTGLRLAYVPGATPGKWVRTWRERLPGVPLDLVPVDPTDAATALREARADVALLRLPVEREGLAVIPLYEEQAVVAVSRDHLLAALDADEAVALADLADEVVLHPLDDALDWPGALPGRPAVERPATTADAVELVAAGVGVLVVPQSLARLHHRKDVTSRRLDGAPPGPVALAWIADRTTEHVEEFVGIVRGRTANSSRGAAREADPSSAARSARSAREKDRGGASARERDRTREPKPKARGARASSGKKPRKKRR